METFGLPWHEIQDRFTRSELVLMGWRSAEQAYKWRVKMNKDPDNVGDADYEENDAQLKAPKGKKRKQYHDSIGPERMSDKYFAQETLRDKRGKIIAGPGDFNLGQVTGEEARRYMSSIGIPLPKGITKITASDDERTEEIRNAYGIRR